MVSIYLHFNTNIIQNSLTKYFCKQRNLYEKKIYFISGIFIRRLDFYIGIKGQGRDSFWSLYFEGRGFLIGILGEIMLGDVYYIGILF